MHRWSDRLYGLKLVKKVLILVLMDHAPVGLKEVTREGYEFVLILVLMDHAPVDDKKVPLNAFLAQS